MCLVYDNLQRHIFNFSFLPYHVFLVATYFLAGPYLNKVEENTKLN